MTLGGLCLSGCCGCGLLGDNFNRPDTTGSAANRFGPQWRVLSGNPQISDNALAMNAGDAIAWLGGFTTLMGMFQVGFSSIADGAVFRIYMGVANSETTPTTNYVEYTYHPYVQANDVSCGPDPGSPESMIEASGSTSASASFHEQPLNETFVPDGSSLSWTCTGSTNGFLACIGQEGSNYHLTGFSYQAGGGFDDAPQVSMTPAGPYVVLQLVSGSAHLAVAAAWDVGDITTTAPTCPNCNSTCGCDASRLSVTVAGLPSACLSSAIANGAYTLECGSTAANPYLVYNKCLFGSATGISTTTLSSPYISFSFDPTNNTTTVNGWITDFAATSIFYQKVVAGTLTCDGLAGVVLTYQRGGGPTGCDHPTLADSTITITAVT